MDKHTAKFQDLRNKAEELLVKNKGQPTVITSEIDELIHELEVYQIELEMQNEELIKTQVKLEESRDDYIQLYDFAPVGYFTLDKDGIIKKVNLAGSALFKVPRKYLVNNAFFRFVAPDYRKIFHDHFQKVRKSSLKHHCEIELVAKDNNPLFVSLDSITVDDEEGNFKELRIIVTDVTERKRADDSLQNTIKHLKQAEFNLNRLNDRMNIISQSAGAGLWDWDIKTGEIEWSSMMFELLGLDPEENTASFETWESVIHPEDSKIAGERIDQAIKNHTFLDSIYRITKPSGQIRWINALGQTEYDDQDDPMDMTGICIDITKRKQAEDKIYRRGRLLNAINKIFKESLTCETVEEVFGICIEVAGELTDSDFGFIGEINSNGRFDYRIIRSLAGDKCQISNVHGLLKDMELVSYWGRVIKEEQSQIVNDPQSDPDQRGLPEGHPPITSFLGVPLKQGPKIIGMMGLANKKEGYSKEDKINIEVISDAFVEAIMRKSAEIQLKNALYNLESTVEDRTKELLVAYRYNRNLIESSLDPLVAIGFDGKITDVNKATEEITGFLREELIGTDFADYFTDPKKAETSYQQVLEYGSVRDYPLEIKNKNNGSTPVLYNASVYKDVYNEVVGVFAAARDITERKNAEAEIREYWGSLEEQVNLRTEELAERTEELAISNADLKQFAYAASHDLREPLRMITSFLQLLERRYQDQLDQDAHEFIDFAVEGAKRMDSMIKDLLEYSRIANKEIMFDEVDLKDVLDQVNLNLKILIKENKAIITNDPLPVIKSDKYQMILLLQNLINNSIKYRREEAPPRIHISARKEDDHYLFSVKDNGLGIDPKQLEGIFNIFKRLHTHDKYEGTGMGLSIAQRIVNQHGGEIWAESGPGRGSIFYFTLPIT